MTETSICPYCGAPADEAHDLSKLHVYSNSPPPITLADLRPGDVIFPTITGYAGALVGAGQVILGDATKAEWRVRHVAMVTQAEQQATILGNAEQMRSAARWLKGPKIVQAMPHGAEEIELTEESFASGFPILRPGYLEPSSLLKLPYRQAEWGFHAAQAAQKYIDVPYSFLDYAAIAGRHVLALEPTQRTPFDRYVTSTGHMICSQLVDQALTDAGYHVFDDGHIPQDVTPAALHRQLKRLPGTQVLR
jgi:hypothetical protein